MVSKPFYQETVSYTVLEQCKTVPIALACKYLRSSVTWFIQPPSGLTHHSPKGAFLSHCDPFTSSYVQTSSNPTNQNLPLHPSTPTAPLALPPGELARSAWEGSPHRFYQKTIHRTTAPILHTTRHPTTHCFHDPFPPAFGRHLSPRGEGRSLWKRLNKALLTGSNRIAMGNKSQEQLIHQIWNRNKIISICYMNISMRHSPNFWYEIHQVMLSQISVIKRRKYSYLCKFP